MAPERVRTVLLTRLRFIGDVVLTTPALHAVRGALPGARILYLAEQEAAALLEHDPAVDRVIGYDLGRPGALETARVAAILRRERIDLALDFFSNPRSALLVALSGARVRVGLDRGSRRRLFTVRVRDDGRPKPATAFHGQLLEAVGIPWSDRPPSLVVTEEERRRARGRIEALLGRGGPVVALHAGGTWPAKLWPAERFAELAGRAADRLGAGVLLSEGPRDAGIVGRVLAGARGRVRRTGVLGLRELVALLAECDAMVSNDAGPMHIAAAVGTPTVGLFGPGEEEIWFPYDRAHGHRALRRDVPCHPCHLDVCNRAGAGYMECMTLLGVDEVEAALAAALAARQR